MIQDFFFFFWFIILLLNIGSETVVKLSLAAEKRIENLMEAIKYEEIKLAKATFWRTKERNQHSAMVR